MFENQGHAGGGTGGGEEPPKDAAVPLPSAGPPAVWGVGCDDVSMLTGSAQDMLLAILEHTPSAETHFALTLVQQRTLVPQDKVLLAVAWERQMSAASANMYAAVADATTAATSTESDLIGAEVGLAMRKGEQAKDMLIAFAHTVTRQLPVMFGLLSRADATLAHVRVLYDETLLLDEEIIRQVDEQVSHRAAHLTVPAFRRVVRRTVRKLDPDIDNRRHQKARHDKTGARLRPGDDGMATVEVTAPTAQAVAMVDEINRRAEASRVPDDPRTHGQRQIDAVEAALFGDEPVAASSAAAGESPAGVGDGLAAKPRRGRRADIVVTIDLDSLLGWRDLPGEMHGIGPVPAQAVRDMLQREGTTIRRVVYDPIEGVLLDLGKRYPVDGALRQLLDFRDVTCRYPGCTRNAIWCDGEHCQPHPDGATSGANCGLVCRKHHNLKTHGGFTYTRPNPETGETVWTTPLGFVYRQDPATYGPDGADTGDTTREALRSRARHRPKLLPGPDSTPDPPERSATPTGPDPPDPPPF